MVIQKLKLHEWFLVYQLDQIKKSANHLPISVKLDVSDYVKEYKRTGSKIPSTALLVKIVGIWAAANPEANKMLFRTFSGLRFLKGDEVRINFPLTIDWQGGSVTTAIVIRNPHLKSILEIQNEIKAAKSKPLSDYPITNWVYSKPNHFFNRFLLRVLHAAIYNSPSLYWKRGGGCISVSSLSNLAKKDCRFSAFSFGSTGFTFFFKDTETIEDKTYLNLGIASDHSCFSGMEIVSLLNKLMTTPAVSDTMRLENITQDLHI